MNKNYLKKKTIIFWYLNTYSNYNFFTTLVDQVQEVTLPNRNPNQKAPEERNQEALENIDLIVSPEAFLNLSAILCQRANLAQRANKSTYYYV